MSPKNGAVKGLQAPLLAIEKGPEWEPPKQNFKSFPIAGTLVDGNSTGELIVNGQQWLA